MKQTMQLLLPCLVSAFVGGLVVVFATDRSQVAIPSAEAQIPQHVGASRSMPNAAVGGVPVASARSSSLPSSSLPSSSLPSSIVPHGHLAHRADLLDEERINNWVYERANRGVVNISVRSIEPGNMFYSEVESQGAGSGVVLDRRGYILTNYHVVEDAEAATVSLFDQSTYAAKLVGVDPATDMAILKIDAPADVLFPVELGDSSQLIVGQKVYALGNPFALERTLTTGIISSLNRSLPSRKAYRMIQQVIQVDAPINPGNSGGPLLDTRGRMVGMNTAIASRTGESAGVGFAVPSNTIARLIPELIANGRIIRAEIGIDGVYEADQGLLISSLSDGGAAERAGLKGPQLVRQRWQQGMFVRERVYADRSAADLIVGVDGDRIESAEEFITLIESKAPGETVTVNIVRDGKAMDVRVVLDAED